MLNQQFNGSFPALRPFSMNSHRVQGTDSVFAEQLIIIHDEYFPWRKNHIISSRRSFFKIEGYMNFSALLQLTLYSYGSLHGINYIFCNRHAQACPLCFLYSCTICPAIGIIYFFQKIRRHSDSIILYTDM